MLVKENTTLFKNQVFNDMIDRLLIDRTNYKDGRPVDEQIMILKFLKMYRNREKPSDDISNFYSLKDLLDKHDRFLQDNVFELNI